MMFCRVLSLVAVLAVASAYPAQAQFGGMPGMPGSPGMGGFGAPPAAAPPAGPPPACVQLMSMRDETQKNAAAIAAASKRKAEPPEACKLFKAFLASEAKYIKGLSDNSTICDVPPQAIKSYQEGHGKAAQVGKQVCDAAEHPRPTGPSLSDTLNSAPVIPDAGKTKSGGGGTFDTLQGNPLAR
jgi:hypothetical protein